MTGGDVFTGGGLCLCDVELSLAGFKLGPVTTRLPRGKILALVGTNGSGKSTLIRSILGLQTIHTGNVLWENVAIRDRDPKLLSKIGYVSDSNRDLLSEFTPLEYWNYCKLAFERATERKAPDLIDRAVYLSHRFDLPYERKVPLGGLSLGTSRKTQIIAALMTEPDLIILDEPFIGLDFLSSRALERILDDLRNEEKTILVSNHDLDLASRIADKILVLHQGRVVLDETVDVLGGNSRLEKAVTDVLEAARDQSIGAENKIRGGRSPNATPNG